MSANGGNYTNKVIKLIDRASILFSKIYFLIMYTSVDMHT